MVRTAPETELAVPTVITPAELVEDAVVTAKVVPEVVLDTSPLEVAVPAAITRLAE
jgi:hypothetical protein